ILCIWRHLDFQVFPSPDPCNRPFFFFFNDTAPTEIYTTTVTLSLHDALPISHGREACVGRVGRRGVVALGRPCPRSEEHTSELQSPVVISYAVFCLKKKK